MDEQIIVFVSDRGDSKHGEISVIDDPQEAERLVETLLEAGFEKERVNVFVGRTNEFQVSHRPVVALGSAADEGELEQPVKPESPGKDGRDEAPQQPRKAAAKVEAKEAAVEAAASEARVEAAAPEARVEAAPESRGQEEPAPEATEGEEDPDEEAAEPVKFSSLFRSA